MDGRTLGRLTIRQMVFWVVAFTILLVDVAILLSLVWPANTGCGCGG